MTVKQIHIEKYDVSAFEKEQKPYLMVLTELIQKFPIQHSRELHLWMFLESLPPTWKPNKHHIMSHFDISERTYERYMSYLNATNLIEYRQERGQDGMFGTWRLVVLNGTRFNPEAAYNRTAKIGGTEVIRKKAKVIHISQANHSAKNGGTVQSSTGRTSIGLSDNPPFRHFTVERCDDGHINTTKISKKERKKTNKPTVSVFSDTESVKTHLNLVIANRKTFVEDETFDQGIFYAFETNQDKSFDSVNKRLNIFLKKVREGKWLTPQGFNGITSQSIRKNEEQYERAKQDQIHSDAQTYRNLIESAKITEGLKNLRNAVGLR